MQGFKPNLDISSASNHSPQESQAECASEVELTPNLSKAMASISRIDDIAYMRATDTIAEQSTIKVSPRIEGQQPLYIVNTLHPSPDKFKAE